MSNYLYTKPSKIKCTKFPSHPKKTGWHMCIYCTHILFLLRKKELRSSNLNPRPPYPPSPAVVRS